MAKTPVKATAAAESPVRQSKRAAEKRTKLAKLFTTADGEPMLFWLRPCPLKREMRQRINVRGPPAAQLSPSAKVSGCVLTVRPNPLQECGGEMAQHSAEEGAIRLGLDGDHVLKPT